MTNHTIPLFDVVLIPTTAAAENMLAESSLPKILLYIMLKQPLLNLSQNCFTLTMKFCTMMLIIIIILAQTPEIGQGLGRFLSCGALEPEQT